MKEQFLAIRKKTLDICAPLEVEDYVVQPSPEVSPPKWHLAHTTWFFETMILIPYLENYKEFNQSFSLLFNSYYKSAGKHWLQGERGQLSRPTVREIENYRAHVDKAVIQLLSSTNDKEVLLLIESGIHHEQQHQELLYMDIKYILGMNPSLPHYIGEPLNSALPPKNDWHEINEGIHEVGHHNEDFSYDNERPLHKTFLQKSAIRTSLVTNGEFLEFINNDGYKRPELWLSLGWDWVNANNIEKPLYWLEREDGPYEYTLHGAEKLDCHAPVTHINYFEANAFAKWAELRLPTEQELEVFEKTYHPDELQETSHQLHPKDANQKSGQLWCWTSSHYSPYPGFQEFGGKLGEYNGKFMCNQMVLRGGCFATAEDHYRASYRNFYQVNQRWMFSGIRLAKDL